MPLRARSVADFSLPMRVRVAMVAFVGLLALTLLGPAMTMLGDGDTGAGNAERQVGYLIVFILAVIAMRPIRHPERLLVVPWPLVAALAWCWLSLSWSIDPGVAVRRLVLTTIIIWSAFAVVRQLGIARLLLFIRCALIIVLIANFVAALAFPEIGIHNPGTDIDSMLVGKWRGIMAHKNIAGLTSALTIIFFTFDRRGLPHALLAVVILLSVIFLWLSDSKTSLGLVFVCMAIGFGIARYATRYAHRLVGRRTLRTAVLAAAVLILFPLIHFGIQSDPVLNYLADPSGLTGRTEIWSAMVRYYLDNPIFSAGYGSFWNINHPSPILTYGHGWVLDIAQGHNGFLDLLVTIGLPGLVLVLAATLIFPVDRLLLRSNLKEETCALVVTLLLFCITHNFTESSLFDRDSIGQVFLMLALAMLWTGELPEAPVRATPPPREIAERARRSASVRSNRDGGGSSSGSGSSGGSRSSSGSGRRRRSSSDAPRTLRED